MLRLNLEIKCECAFNKEQKRIQAAPYIKHMKLEGLDRGGLHILRLTESINV